MDEAVAEGRRICGEQNVIAEPLVGPTKLSSCTFTAAGRAPTPSVQMVIILRL